MNVTEVRVYLLNAVDFANSLILPYRSQALRLLVIGGEQLVNRPFFFMLGFQVALHVVVVIQIHLLASLVRWTTLGIHLTTLVYGIRAQAPWSTCLYGVIFVPGIKASLFAVIILLAFTDDLIDIRSWSQLRHLVINSVET